MERTSFVDQELLTALNNKIARQGSVSPVNLLDFLRTVETTDGPILHKELQDWLAGFEQIPDIASTMLSDLENLGFVSADTINYCQPVTGGTLPL